MKSTMEPTNKRQQENDSEGQIGPKRYVLATPLTCTKRESGLLSLVVTRGSATALPTKYHSVGKRIETHVSIWSITQCLRCTVDHWTHSKERSPSATHLHSKDEGRLYLAHRKLCTRSTSSLWSLIHRC
jgi:hypothetical protein